MKYILLLFALFFSSISLSKKVTHTDCEFFFQKEKICAKLTWTKKPAVVDAPTAKDAASFDLQLWDSSKTPDSKLNLPTDKSLAVSLYMPSMGHGSEPVIIKKDEKTPGLFHISQVLFSMEGEWEIRGRIEKSGAVVDKAFLPFNFSK